MLFFEILNRFFRGESVVASKYEQDLLFRDLSLHISQNSVLRWTLGIILLSEQPISCSQIAQMIHLLPDKILLMLRRVCFLFAHGSLDLASSPIHVSHSSLADFLFDSARSGGLALDRAMIHAVLAHWCLSDEREFPRDIMYARRHWAHHVCRSVPSTSLINDLRVSQLPFALSSHKSLPKVIAWLKETPQSLRDADLISKLERHHFEIAAKLATTGVQHQSIAGAVTTVFTSTDHLAKTDSPYVWRMNAGSICGTHMAVAV